jgi:hypothetical protein
LRNKSLVHFIFLLLLLHFSFLGCSYNPLGTKNSNHSHVDKGNSPFLSSPREFFINGLLFSDGQVNLSWTVSQKADDYSVVYGTSSGNYPNKVVNCTNIKNTLCTVTNLTNGTTYYFNIIARNSFGSLSVSREVTVTPNPFSIVVKPNSMSAIISWGDITAGFGNTNYTLKYGTSPDSLSNNVASVKSPHLLKDLSDGETYYFQIIANNITGTVYSLVVSALIIGPPLAPIWKDPPVVSSNQIAFYWKVADGKGTIRYTLYRSAEEHGNYKQVPGRVTLNNLTCNDVTTDLIPGHIYHFYLIATNEGGDSPSSAVANATTNPAIPTGLVATADRTSNILNWDKSPGNADITYKIYRSLTSPVEIIPGNLVGNVNSTFLSPNLSFKDNGLFDDNKFYYYSLTATNVSGFSGKSTDTNIASPLKTQPSSLSSTSITSNSLTLNWNLSVGNLPITFKVYRSIVDTDLNLGIALYTGTNKSYGDADLQENTKYYYMVTAVNSRPDAEPQKSSIYNVVTALKTLPTFKETETEIESESIKLSWNPSPGNGTVNYRLYRSPSGDDDSWVGPINTPLSATSYKNTGLSENTVYYYKVTAKNTAPGATELSSVNYKVTTDLKTKPKFKKATGISWDKITLNWEEYPRNDNITYKLYRSETNITGPIALWGDPIVTSTGANSYEDSGLVENTTYYYKLTARNDSLGGTILESDVLSVTTQFKSTTTFVLKNGAVTNTTAVLEWTMNVGNSNVTYKVLLSGSAISSSKVTSCSLSNKEPSTTKVTCNVTGLTQNMDYIFSIQATNNATGGSTSIKSNDLTITTQFTSGTDFTLSSESVTDTSFTLKWTLNVGNSKVKYSVLKDNSPISLATCTLTEISPSTEVSCPITGLTQNSSYIFKVTATNTATGGDTSISSKNLNILTKPKTAPSGLKARILSSTSINLSWNTNALGNAVVKYKVYVSTSSPVSIIDNNIFCVDNVQINSCSGAKVSGSSLVDGQTYQFVIVAVNDSGDSDASSPTVNILFKIPTNNDNPKLTGNPDSGIVSNADDELKGSLGTWSDIDNYDRCTYQWYANGAPIDGESGEITKDTSPVTYKTKDSDVCSVISFSVKCKNGIGSTEIFNKSPNNGKGINTTAIVDAYANRVTSVVNNLTEVGKTEIKNFLDKLIENKLPLPNVLYAMRSHQNVGVNNILYDLYCGKHNATLTRNAWNPSGINTNNISTPMTMVPNIFSSSNDSTIIALARSPLTLNFHRGIAAYTGGSLRSFGYGFSSNQVHIQSGFTGTHSYWKPNLHVGIYDFFGFSVDSSNFYFKLNSLLTNTIPTTTARSSGGLIIGSFENHNIEKSVIYEYIPFVAAWNSKRLDYLQMETIRQAYFPTLGVGLQTFAYLSGRDKNTVYRCGIDFDTGVLNKGCLKLSTGALDQPSATVISSSNILYTVNRNGGKVFKSVVILADGTLEAASEAGAVSGGPHGMVITNTNIYFSDIDGKKVWQCTLKSDGTFDKSACAGTSLGMNAQGVIIIGNYIYVTSSDNKVALCDINTDGTINSRSCKETAKSPSGGSYSNLRSIASATIGSNTYAYITSFGNDRVYRCLFNASTGDLSNCVSNQNIYGGIRGIFIYKLFNGTVKAYFANRTTNAVTICTINSSANLGDCTQYNGSDYNFDAPEDIFIKNL